MGEELKENPEDMMTPENREAVAILVRLLEQPSQETWKEAPVIIDRLKTAYPEYSNNSELKEAAKKFLFIIIRKLSMPDNMKAARELIENSELLSPEETDEAVSDVIVLSLRRNWHTYDILGNWGYTGLPRESLDSPEFAGALTIGLASEMIFETQGAGERVSRFDFDHEIVQNAIDMALNMIRNGEGPEEIPDEASGLAGDEASEEDIKEIKRTADSRISMIKKVFGINYEVE